MSTSRPDLSTLASRTTGPVIPRDQPGFAEALSGFNTAIVHSPDAVVVVETADDVVETVRFARESSAAGGHVPVRALATGHGGYAPVESGIIVATRGLTGVAIDPVARTATFGSGMPWGPIVAAAAEHGLAPIVGASPTVGAVGYLLGGGIGPLARSHGFSSDYLRSVQIVAGTGELVTASADENPDLFWALRGGKGGLGIVVEATVDLVELSTLYGGTMFFDAADGTAVLGGWIAWGRDADERVSSSLAIIKFPDLDVVPPPLRGRHLIGIRFAFPGDSAEGEALAAPLRALAPVRLDGVAELPAGQIARVHNDPTNPGPGWGRGAALGELDDAFVEAFLGQLGEGTRTPFIVAELRLLGGAVSRDVAGGSAIGGRDVAHVLHLVGAPDPSLFATVLPGAADALLAELGTWISPVSTINWVSDPTDPVGFASAWTAETRERLARVRAQYDPDRVFPYGPAD